MAAAPVPSRQDYFRSGVDSVVSNWTALRMMVSNSGFGDDFVSWLVGATVQWFAENRDLAWQEVEGFFVDVVVTEFNVSVEDGSLAEVGRKVCDLYAVCMNKPIEEVQAKIRSLPKGTDLAACRTREYTSQTDYTESGGRQDVHGVCGALSSCNLQEPENGGEEVGACSNGASTEADESSGQSRRGGGRPKPEVDEDGWTTVPTRKKK